MADNKPDPGADIQSGIEKIPIIPKLPGAPKLAPKKAEPAKPAPTKAAGITPPDTVVATVSSPEEADMPARVSKKVEEISRAGLRASEQKGEEEMARIKRPSAKASPKR